MCRASPDGPTMPTLISIRQFNVSSSAGTARSAERHTPCQRQQIQTTTINHVKALRHARAGQSCQSMSKRTPRLKRTKRDHQQPPGAKECADFVEHHQTGRPCPHASAYVIGKRHNRQGPRAPGATRHCQVIVKNITVEVSMDSASTVAAHVVHPQPHADESKPRPAS